MSDPIAQQLADLRGRIAAYGSVLVAYSGGVDSTLVAFVAHEQLGGRALACIGASPSLPTRELEQAVSVAKQIGVAHRMIDTQEHLDARYLSNAADRCFVCKSHLFERLRDVASREGWREIADGVHADDRADHHHGINAARVHGIRSPLLAVGLGKRAVRELAKYLGLPVWDKPAAPCLASRVPCGTAITPQLLKQIERAEDVLAGLGFRQFRVRHHGELARIELAAMEMPRAMEMSELIVVGLRTAGYRFVTLDLAGFRAESVSAPVATRVCTGP